ncbi:hypothetical protein [Pedobacter montanisoli]|uniref:Uncharacterized protein n=1 Tax=Pedobacter montanisoli TaxID=2923277 RepID=A0ABS9ZT63_9SPHI|nr:hypothetical protein [Pedobacter montanisoli]MCJ0741412.1 hypothetical protein [Pedobacter montanisoli]
MLAEARQTGFSISQAFEKSEKKEVTKSTYEERVKTDRLVMLIMLILTICSAVISSI